MRIDLLSLKPIAIILAILLTGSAATAESVLIFSLDRSVSMSGELVSFDGKNYVIRSMLGEVTIAADQVTCEGEACPVIEREEKIVISGSNVIGEELMPNLIEYFGLARDLRIIRTLEGDHLNFEFVLKTPAGEDYLKVMVAANGSTTGLQSLISGDAEFAMTTRQPNELESAAMQLSGIDNPNTSSEEAMIGLDGLVFVVSKDNPVQSLSIDEIVAIFAGNITNWSEVGGPDKAITINRLDNNSGSTDMFRREMLEPLAVDFTPNARTFTENHELTDAVGLDPSAIGYSTFSLASGSSNASNVKAMPVRGRCGIVSTPSDFTIKTGEYPFARRLFVLASAASQNEKAQEFLDFLHSEESQLAVSSSGFVDSLIEEQPLSMQGDRMVSMILSDQEDISFNQVKLLAGEILGAQRLSTTFRFGMGISKLDVWSASDIGRLAEYLEAGDFSTREILFLGFTDSVGSAAQNQTLSGNRAQFVMDELKARLGGSAAKYRMSAQGFGEASPLDCNDTLRGRNINRRVEVWLREIR